MIEFRDVSFGYDTLLASHLSFTIARGEFWGIVGPNGAGKSTLLKLLLNIVHAQAGEVRVDGRAIGEYDRKTIAQKIAFVPQEEQFEFPFRVEEVVQLGRTPYLSAFGFESENDRRITQDALQKADLTHLAERNIQTLSGGERKRVLIARAIAQTAPVMLLDEPTAGLDLQHQVELFDLLAGQHKQTVIVVMHDLTLAAAFCKRLVLLHHGNAIIGTVDEVLSAANVTQAFGVQMHLLRHPDTNSPVLLPRLKR